jgi:CRISPR system Cascade subunit CasE
MRLCFRLRANPTRRISSQCAREKNQQAIGKRVEIRNEEEQIKWLQRKGEVIRDQNGVLTGGGFRLLSVKVNAEVANVRATPEDKFFGWRVDKPDTKSESPGKKHRLTFGSVLFEGVLEITDAERLQKTLEAGIGSGKAYGFGLLSIAPA